MLCAILRRSPRLTFRHFSTSQPRHEIKDIGSLSQRLIPKYQGVAWSRVGPVLLLIRKLMHFLRILRRGAPVSPVASTAAKYLPSAQRLCPGGYRFSD